MIRYVQIIKKTIKSGSLDYLLLHYGNTLKEKLGVDILEIEGAGAAGGLGAALLVFLPSKNVSWDSKNTRNFKY